MLNGAMDKYTGAGLISLAMGGLSLILGVLFRTGLVHADLASLYRDPAAPVTQRNSVFGFIPLGLAFVALGLLPLIATSQWGIVLALITLAVSSLIFGFVVVLHPPWWMKPRWLREAEVDGWRHYTRPPFPVTKAVVATAIVLVLGSAVAFILTQATPLELIGSLLIGLGAVTAFVVGRRRR
jgi:hypothetical protein